MKRLKNKINISGRIRLLTGMFIGIGNEFSTIGAVDSMVIKDPLTQRPILPGSSLKGKLRSLLEQVGTDADSVKQMFGGTDDGYRQSKLQFFDLFLTDESAEMLLKAPTDMLYTEIKFENTINRGSGEAKPRQNERVPAGGEFDLRIVYNYFEGADIEADFEMIAKAFELLHYDYIGGNGTRGYGRVQLLDAEVRGLLEDDEKTKAMGEKLNNVKNNPIYNKA